MRLRIILLFSLVFVCVGNSFQEVSHGEIRGVVVDEQNHPIEKMKVILSRENANPKATLIPKVDTDAAGRFSFSSLEFATYNLFTEKESDDYPNTRISLYRSRPPVEVTLDASQPIRDVAIIAGPKAGKLVGSVTDAANRAPLPAAVRIWDANKDNNWIEMSLPSSYEILVPSNIEVGLMLLSPGYMPSYYPGTDQDSQANRIVLKPGERMVFNVLLRKTDQSAPK